MMTVESSRLNGLAGNAQIEALQTALTSLAQAASWPAVNPGPVDGVVGVRTRTAVIAVVTSVPQIPSAVKYAFIAAGIGSALSTKAAAEVDGLIAGYATELTQAIKAYIAVRGGSTQPGTMPGHLDPRSIPQLPSTGFQTKPSPGAGTFWSPPAGTPWYKQGRVYAVGGGIAALGVGAFFLFRR